MHWFPSVQFPFIQLGSQTAEAKENIEVRAKENIEVRVSDNFDQITEWNINIKLCKIYPQRICYELLISIWLLFMFLHLFIWDSLFVLLGLFSVFFFNILYIIFYFCFCFCFVFCICFVFFFSFCFVFYFSFFVSLLSWLKLASYSDKGYT